MEAALKSLRPGITELEVAEQAAAFFRRNGAYPGSVSVCFGDNAAYPHHTSSQRIIDQNDTVLIDLCGLSRKYWSDMTRVASVGNAPGRFTEIVQVVELALLTAMKSVTVGMNTADIDEVARDIIREAGFGAFFFHRTGHGIGLDIHERPYITSSSIEVVQEGMAFSIEPGIYIEGEFGVRLEEVVRVRNGRPAILSTLSRSCWVV